MHGHKQLNLILALLLLPAAIVWPIRSATPPGTNSLAPETLQGIPGANAEWRAAVQKDLPQSEGHITGQMAGVTGLSLVPDWLGEGNQEDADFGYSVGTAGDVNGDGYDDVIVGAIYYTNGQDAEGAAAVYYGSADGLSLVPNWLAEGDQADSRFGWSVGTAGDVNGDGYDDIIVGAPLYDRGQTDEGVAAVFYGSATGLSLVPNWGDEGDQAGAEFGYSVGTAGDVNGDGYDDVIVGAPIYEDGQTREGAAAVYHGSAGGLAFLPGWLGEGDQVNAVFGYAVGTAGDVNGDGYADVIVSAPNYENGQANEGAAFVYHGSASGLSQLPAWMDEGDQVEAYLGDSVGTAVDVNGDGYDDVIVGASDYDHGEVDEGVAVVYHGSAAGLSLVPNWLGESNQAFSGFGWSSGTAGDVNGDGYDDVIVGAPEYNHGQLYEGAAVVYLGSATGLSLVPNWGDEGDQIEAYLGDSVGTAGDVNGDGYSDVIVGAPGYDLGQLDEGVAAVYHGSGTNISHNLIYMPLALRNP